MTNSIMIVGAGPGIGMAVAQRFGREGWHVVLTSRRAERLDSLVGELSASGIKAHAVPADAGDAKAIRAAVAQADTLTEGLSVVCFNAAVMRQQDLFSMTDEEIDQDLAVNVAGGLHTIRAAVAAFGSRGGTILVTSGALATTPHASYASLGLGKAALRNIVQALAEPLAAQNIRIGMATVAAQIDPGSPAAEGVADTFWRMTADEDSAWEVFYPQP